MAHRLWDIVNGSKPIPEAAAARETWSVQNANAMYLLSSTLEPEQKRPMLTCETACEMWQKLARIHEQKSASNKLLLSTRLYEYRMSASDSITQHMTKVQNMAAQLLDVGETVIDTAIMAKILGSLTPKFATFQTAWANMPPDMQTLQNLEERLLREEARMTENDESESAFVVSKKSKEKSKSSASSREAKNKKDGKDIKDRKDKKKVRCFRCQGLGHFARECKKDKKEGNRGTSESSDCAFVVESGKSGAGKSGFGEIPTDLAHAILKANKKDCWISDSGASQHMTFRREWLRDFRELPLGEHEVALGDDKVCYALGVGTVDIEKFVNGKWIASHIKTVLYVPELKKNLFSVGACARKKIGVYFFDEYVKFDNRGFTVGYGVIQSNNLYRMLFKTKCAEDENEASVAKTSFLAWHERLGHVNVRAMRKLVSEKLIDGIEITDGAEDFCGACQEGKSQRKAFKKTRVRADTEPGEVIHSDVCGPMSVESIGGSRFMVVFKDDATNFRYAYFLKHKNEVLEKFKKLDRLIKNKFGRNIRVLRTDNGLEYKNRAFDEYADKRGIEREYTAPYTPEQNGKAERDNRTLVESARTMLLAKGLPKNLWAEACSTAVYLANRAGASSTKVGATPYELWMGVKPDLHYLKIFGSEAYVNVPKIKRTKLDARAKKMIFVGYDSNSSNYRVFDPVSKRVSVSRDVTFRETTGSVKLSEPKDAREVILPKVDREDLVPAEGDSTDEEGEDDEVFENAVNDEQRDKGRQQVNEPVRKLQDRSSIKKPSRYEADAVECDIPITYREAVESKDAAKWREAIDSELESHEKNGTWYIVKRDPKMKPIDSKWVFKKLKNEKGEIRRFKARLCARGFMQEKNIDYTEMFSPVVRYDSLRVLLAIAASKNLEIAQFDVQTAFLYGTLDEEIYMEIPEGLSMDEETREEQVCRLVKSLYGLKQSPRCWNQKFSSFLRKFRFQETSADKCIFVGEVNGETVYLALFVDDGLVIGKTKGVIEVVLQYLKRAFKITVGDGSLFIGAQIERDRDKRSIFVHQTLYAKKILERFGMSEAKSVSVPSDPNTTLLPVSENDERIEKVPYREAVGSLMYLSIVSRPDLAFAVNSVSKFLNKHNREHWQAVKRILSYVAGTMDCGIEYRGSENDEITLEGYSDSDYAGDVETRRSTTGYVFQVAGGPVTWASQRQKLVTLSTTEAEYVAASITAREAVWLRKLLEEVNCLSEGATTVYVDNQSSIRLVKNPEFHKRTKHIDVRYHFVRERVQRKELEVDYIESAKQKADIFTKALPRNRFCELREEIGVRERPRTNGGSIGVVRCGSDKRRDRPIRDGRTLGE